jgi:hypothetical protein
LPENERPKKAVWTSFLEFIPVVQGEFTQRICTAKKIKKRLKISFFIRQYLLRSGPLQPVSCIFLLILFQSNTPLACSGVRQQL